LDDFEAFELRVAKIKWGVAVPDVAGIAVSGTECLRLGPALERRLVRPDRVTGIQDVVLPLRAAQQAELDEARNLLQMRVAAGPNVLERGLRQPSLTTLFLLGRALSVKPSELVSRIEASKPEITPHRNSV